MKLPWLLGWAWLFAAGATAHAELVFSTIAGQGTMLPGSGVGEVYTVSKAGEARALTNGKVYFWARATSSLAIAGTREGIWSWQNGAYTLELLEGNAVSGGGGGLSVGKFDANEAGDVIKNFAINPSGALLVSVRLRGGNTNATTDQGVIYHKAGVNTLLQRSALADATFSVGVSLLAEGATYTEFATVNNVISQFLSMGLPFQGLPSISAVANSGAGVIGEAGSTYLQVSGPVQDANGTVAYMAIVQTAAAIESRIGVYSGPYTFPVAMGTAIAGTGGALTLNLPYALLPAPGGGWWITGSVSAGGADAGIELPFLFRNGSLTSLFPGGALAGIFGEDGQSTAVTSLGAGLDGDLGFVLWFAPTNGGGERRALVHRRADGTFQRIIEKGTIVTVDGATHAVVTVSQTTQPFTRDGKIAFKATLDGNQDFLLAARAATESPQVRIESPRRHRTTERRITLRGTASDDGTVTQVRYRVNRGGERAADGTTRWNFTTPRLREGRNRIVVQATDGDGGLSAPAQFLVRYTPR